MILKRFSFDRLTVGLQHPNIYTFSLLISIVILCQLLLAYLNITRYEGPEIDAVSVEADAKAIHKGADSKLFIHIFTERSRAHMSALISVYSGLYGTPLEQVNLRFHSTINFLLIPFNILDMIFFLKR